MIKKRGFFYHFHKYRKKILLGDCNSKVEGENIFKPTSRNESLHHDRNYNGVRILNLGIYKT